MGLSVKPLRLNLAERADLYDLVLQIAGAQILMCKSIAGAIISKNAHLSPHEYEPLDSLVGELPARSADSFARFISSGFEAAALLPLELARVGFLVYQREFDDSQTELGGQALNQIFNNSRLLISHITRLPFTEFREFIKQITEDRSSNAPWKLDPNMFTIKGDLAKRSLHLDLKNELLKELRKSEGGSVQVLKILTGPGNNEFAEGCPGLKYLPFFYEWARELYEVYLLPRMQVSL